MGAALTDGPGDVARRAVARTPLPVITDGEWARGAVKGNCLLKPAADV